MPFIETGFKDLLIFEPKIFEDRRGYFYESYNENTFLENGIDVKFVQDNQSQSNYGVIRGLHYQAPPHAQTKLVRVLSGCIKDVVVDLRVGSPTYGKHFGIVLTGKNKKQLLVPKGFAHGFAVMSDTAEISYKCDSLYHKKSERGLIYNDTNLGINWQIPESKIILSDKDALLPHLRDCKSGFVFKQSAGTLFPSKQTVPLAHLA